MFSDENLPSEYPLVGLEFDFGVPICGLEVGVENLLGVDPDDGMYDLLEAEEASFAISDLGTARFASTCHKQLLRTKK